MSLTATAMRDYSDGAPAKSGAGNSVPESVGGHTALKAVFLCPKHGQSFNGRAVREARKSLLVPTTGTLTRTVPSTLISVRGRIQPPSRSNAMTAQTLAPVVSILDGKPVTTSQHVAEHFHKDHKKVLLAIRNLAEQLDQDFNGANFGLVEYIDAKGEKRPAYTLTRDGFTLLAMGFTGKRALQFKLAYITAFNAMEAQLQHPALPSNLTQAQQRHIQKRVAELAYRPGNSFAAVYGSIKDRFSVGTYSAIPAEQYPALCRFLQCEPLDGIPLLLTGDAMTVNLPGPGRYLVATDGHGATQVMDVAQCSLVRSDHVRAVQRDLYTLEQAMRDMRQRLSVLHGEAHPERLEQPLTITMTPSEGKP